MNMHGSIGVIFVLAFALIPLPGSTQPDRDTSRTSSTTTGRSPVPAKQGNAPIHAASAQQSPAGGGQAVRWHDGSVDRELRIDPTRVVDFRTLSVAGQASLRSRSQSEKHSPALPAGVSPVFVDPVSPSQIRALPGGVTVALRHPPAGNDPVAREAEGRRQIAAAGLHALRPIGPDARRWLVASPPGMPALELANRLQESGVFESASPNWWKPRALK
jgi:hypothetical protein